MLTFDRCPGESLAIGPDVELLYVRTLKGSPRALGELPRELAYLRLTLRRALRCNGVMKLPSDGPIAYTLYAGESVQLEGNVAFSLIGLEAKRIRIGVHVPRWLQIKRSELT
jgi:sRNA-binding carbon storage regulator CsrA